MTLGLTLVMALFAVVASVSLRSVSGMGNDVKDVIAENELIESITRKEVDHLKGADVIRDAFLEGKDTVNVENDPARCALGKWLNSEQARKAHDEGFKQAWGKMLDAHKRLHESAIEICGSFGQGDQGKVQAKKTFQENTLPILHEIMAQMNALKQKAEDGLVGAHKANMIFATQTKPNLEKTQELLNEATSKVSEVVSKTNSDTLASARFTRLTVSVLSTVAVVLGLVATFVIARGITNAPKQFIDSLTEGAEQVSSASDQVSFASQSLAEGATEQAAGPEETSSSLEEMSSMTTQNADNAQQVNALASEARNAAMAQIDRVIQQNAANAEENAGASEELNAQAESVNEVVNQLAGLVGGMAATMHGGGHRNRHHRGSTLDHSMANKAHGPTSRHRSLGTSDNVVRNIAAGNGTNCWDVRKCSRIPGGDRVNKLGVCPAYPGQGTNSWKVAGTFCGGEVQ